MRKPKISFKMSRQLTQNDSAGNQVAKPETGISTRSETLARQTEELYRLAIAGAGAVPYSYDYKTRTYTFIGDGIEQLIGYSREEVSPALWCTIIKESIMLGETAGLEKVEAARRVTIGEIRNWRCDMRVVTRSGKMRWISDASVQVLDESGRPTASMGILEDITERKQMEAYARAFSKLGHDMVISKTPKDAALSIARVTEEFFNWDACSFYLYFEETDMTFPLLYFDTLKGDRTDVTPVEMQHPTPVTRRVLVNGAELVLKKDPQIMEEGSMPYGNVNRPSASIMRVPVRTGKKTVGLLSIHSYQIDAYTQKDLSTLQALGDYCGAALERIWAEVALRKSESQFRVVWDSSVDAMRLTNSEGILVQVNDAYCRLVQRSKQELEGKSLAVAAAPEYTKDALLRLKHVFETKQMLDHHETEVTLWNGHKFWAEISNSFVELPEQPPLVLDIIRDISSRKNAEASLKKANEDLFATSRMAGMAEVATSVLHNVGNVLNSINVSSNLVSDKVRSSKVSALSRAVGLIQAHAADLGAFFTQDPKGRQLPDFLEKLASHLSTEQAAILDELALMCSNVEHVKEIVAMQQSYAKVSGMLETMSIESLVEDALRMNAGGLERHQVTVIRDYQELPPVSVEKHKVLQILINLIRNAKYAVDKNPGNDRRIMLKIESKGGDFIRVLVSDNGMGIPAENMTRIFNHGFTTRKEGHGFGLHSGALAAKELGGSLNGFSDGPGKGATFVLELPMNRPERES